MSCACRTAVGANRNAYMIENTGNVHINGRCKRSIFRDKLTSLRSEHILERPSTVSADCTLMTEWKHPPTLPQPPREVSFKAQGVGDRTTRTSRKFSAKRRPGRD